MIMKKLVWLTALAASLASLPTIASAQSAQAAKVVNLRAGPGREYPLVGQYGPGTPLAVQGCTDGYGWCDVVGPDDNHGWVYAGNINYQYEQRYVPLPYYGPQLAVPIVAFSIGTYWGSYYRGRPFYRDYPRWERHRPPPPPVWRPRPGLPPPPHYGGGGRPPPPQMSHRPPPRPGPRPPEHRPPPPPQTTHRPGPPQQAHRPGPPPQAHRQPVQQAQRPAPAPRPARPAPAARPAPSHGGGNGDHGRGGNGPQSH